MLQRNAAASLMQHPPRKNTESIGNDDLVLDAYQLADRLSLKPSQVWRLHRQGKIPVITLGRRTHRYRLDEVMAALAKQTRAATVKEALS